MSLQTTISVEWRGWLRNQPRLSTHLPRLVLHNRLQPHDVRQCEVTQQLLPLLRLLDWEQLPTTLTWHCSGERTVPLAAYISAYLVKFERQLPTFGALRRFLREHPALIWVEKSGD